MLKRLTVYLPGGRDRSYGLGLNGLPSPPGPSGCDSESCPAEQERNVPPDVELAGAVKFRMVGETNGSPYQAVTRSGEVPERATPTGSQRRSSSGTPSAATSTSSA
ncbi:hypothetical protein Dcae01_02654 [Deinococcus caeni]|uniref:Uncharacterized protein n=1 Tax=Deinococcus caeni TaxID=569127 RepID=A0ABP9UH77_9DEIO